MKIADHRSCWTLQPRDQVGGAIRFWRKVNYISSHCIVLQERYTRCKQFDGSMILDKRKRTVGRKPDNKSSESVE